MLEALLHRQRLYSRAEVLSHPCPVPSASGIYAWFFREAPPAVPIDDCETRDGLTLLYVGISPDKKRKPNSRSNLKVRVQNHFRGNAEGSTLRRTLGVLLSEKSSFPLTRVGSGRRMTFTHAGEQCLDQWMNDNAFVSWIVHPTPWELEDEMIQRLSLPLNIRGNENHPFVPLLKSLRSSAIKSAREMPIADESSQTRTYANRHS